MKTTSASILLVSLLIGCGGASEKPAASNAPAQPSPSGRVINGAGATFPYPLYSKWFDEYGNAHPGVRVNYQSIGSGGGIKQLSAKTVFFGATDGPMTDEQLKAAP